jgi:hypothetical protein
MIKALKKLGKEGMYLNIIKVVFNKPLANIILNGEKLKPFLPKLLTRQSFHSFHSYSTPLEFLARTSIRQEEVLRVIQIKKKEIKLFLFADDMILFLRDMENSTKKA